MTPSGPDDWAGQGRVRDEPAPEPPPWSRRVVAAGCRAAVHGVRVARCMFVTLTRPLPGHVAEYREIARTALVGAALLIVGLTLVIAQQPEIDRTVLQTLGLVGALFGMASLVPALQPVLNRCDGLVALALIAALVTVSGGNDSIYRPLFIFLLLYAALFYDTGRLVITGALLLAATLAPLAWDGAQPAHLAVLAVQIPVWALTAGVAHALVQRTRATARTDGLTGLENHVTFQSVLQAEHERMRRYGSPYSVLLIDIDHFKQVNDTRGHPVGDEVLRGLGRLLDQRTRVTDTVARYGGEEFAVLLPETSRENAIALAEDLRSRIRDADLPVPVTVSIGIASSADGLVDTAEALLAKADEALYEAKRKGRNRVAVCGPETPATAYLSDGA
ncbi:MAG TPA: GGDEF domain-containing protein [Egibacteraceae bacterium]|nr:GGDEF domain-containing protein [Egibacteraceae bacterium]